MGTIEISNTADRSRWVSSGEAFGYYDPIPPGTFTYRGIGFEISYVTGTDDQLGLRNTMVMKPTLPSGSNLEILFGKKAEFFDANLSFDGSVGLEGIDLAGLEITEDALVVEIGGVVRSYSSTDGSLDLLVVDLVDFGVSQSAAEDFKDVVKIAFEAIDVANDWIKAIFEHFDNLELSEVANGVSVDLSSEIATALPSGAQADIDDVVNVTATSFQDSLVGDSGRNALLAGDEADTLDGGEGHDELHGGEGSDSIDGGDGADILFDNGAASFEDLSFEEDNGIERSGEEPASLTLHSYDGEGNDTLTGGAGSDIFVYSGGTDAFDGGLGHDLFLASSVATATEGANDYLTLNYSKDTVEEETGTPDNPDAEPETAFGHDLIYANDSGVDRIVFEGINYGDVTISYHYEIVATGSHVIDVDPLFGWFADPDPLYVTENITVGTFQIVLNDKSSVSVEGVLGDFWTTSNGGGIAGLEASMAVPFVVEFEDGIMSWPDAVLDPSTNSFTFKNSPLFEPAYVPLDEDLSEEEKAEQPRVHIASVALEVERAQPGDTIAGTDGDDEQYGSIESEQFAGGDGNDTMFGGGGSDYFDGGAGADYFDGGSGIDTVTYKAGGAGVSAYMRGSVYDSGDAEGDVFVNVENLEGSLYADNLYGDESSNVITGLDGDDDLYGSGGNDTLIGGLGNDSIEASRLATTHGHDLLKGGDGNDTLLGYGGDDTLIGGDGDDLLSSGGSLSGFEVTNPGNDVLDGGAGVDTAQFEHEHGVFVDLQAQRADYGLIEDFTRIYAVENIIGSRQADGILGDAGDNVLDGNWGDDTLLGGAGDDTVLGSEGHNALWGGTGIDTAQIEAVFSSATIEGIEGGIRITIDSAHPDFIWPMEDGTHDIMDDIEFISFDDVTYSYADLATSVLTEFAVIDDNLRVAENETTQFALLHNDLEMPGDPIALTKINGQAVAVGDSIRLDTGALLNVLAGGVIEYDQQGAFSWLDAGETHTLSFEYSAVDANGTEKTALVTAIVNGADSAASSLHLSNDIIMVESDADKAAMHSVANFDIARSVVLVNRQYVDPNDPPAGVHFEEHNGSTFIIFGDDDAIILEDVLLSAWQYVSAQRQQNSASSETIDGTIDDDVITAGGGNDTVWSDDGDDVILGESGNDELYFGKGSNIVFGGDGEDHITEANTAADRALNRSDDDTLFGGDGDDYIDGGHGNDEIHGDDGADIISGNLGNDSLYGGAGDDHLSDSDGVDYFDGGEGFDTLSLNSSASGETTGVTLYWSAGLVVRGSGVVERFTSIEEIVGTTLGDLIYGSDDGIEANGEAGDDTVIGGLGDDTLLGASGDDSIDGGEGADFLWGYDGADTLIGGAGNDSINGHDGDDAMYGGSGDDTIVSSAGHDYFDGNEGVDTLDFGGATGANTVDLALGRVTWFGSTTYETAINFENVVGTQGDNTIIGNEFNNLLRGEDGADTLIGGSAGDDTLIGGAGNDTVIYALERAAYDISENNGQIAVADISNAHSDLISEVEFFEFSDGVVSVDDLLLVVSPPPTDEILVVDGAVSGTYGNKFSGLTDDDGLLSFAFEGSAQDLTLSLLGYDIDTVDEVEVLLNGSSLGYLELTANNAFSVSEFTILAADLDVGTNGLVFRQSHNNTYVWGVDQVALSTGTNPPPPAVDETLVVDGPASGTFGNQVNGLSDEDGLLTFAFESTGEDLTLILQGYDIDFADEVEVLLNGASLGYLAQTADNGYGASEFDILVADLQSGTNTLEFHQTHNTTYVWGVDQVALIADEGMAPPPAFDATLVVDGVASGTFGNQVNGLSDDDGLVGFEFESSGEDLTLSLQGYDIDTVDEVEVLLNGSSLGYLELTGNNAYGTSEFDIAAADLQSGSNTLQFQQNHNTTYVWGVHQVALSTDNGTLPPAADAELLVDGPASGTYGNKLTGLMDDDGLLSFVFESTGEDLSLSLQGYDVDFVDEVEVLLNGASLGYLALTANNGYGASEFDIAVADLQSGSNTLEFRQAHNNTYVWGVHEVALAAVDELIM